MNPNAQQPQLAQVNVHELMERFRSKKELYDFLCQDCKAYMPKIDSPNVYFYKQVARGAKEVSLRLPMAVVYKERLGQNYCSTSPVKSSCRMQRGSPIYSSTS